MRALYPAGDESLNRLSDDDLVELYAFPIVEGGQRGWLRANFVSTLDGAAQGSDSRSGSLSSPMDQHLFGLQRSLCDVIIAGANTTRVEGYRPVKPSEAHTTLRALHGLAPLPAIAVVSRSLDIDLELLRGASAPTIVVTVESAPPDRLEAVGLLAPVIVSGEHDVDFAEMTRRLTKQGYPRMLCEGGPTLMRSLVASGTLDDLCLTFSALLSGGDRLRITHGPDLDPPQRMRLAHLLEHEGDLFARYTTKTSPRPR
ncbi:MAG: dihydrofolate reductase family protein [Nocardioidaceae bacterium]